MGADRLVNAAFVTSWLSRSGGGGVATAIESMSRELHGPSVSVSVLGLADADWVSDEKFWQGAPVRAFPVIGPRGLGVSPGLRRAIVDLGPDLVHTHGIWMHPSADVVAWSDGKKPYLVTPHGMLDPWALSVSASKKRLARALYEDQHLRGAACLHALCTQEVEAIRAFGLVNPICMIPNGVEIPRVGPLGRSPWARRFGADVRVLLYLGRLHPKKNLLGLIEALALIKKAGGLAGWRVAIAGWDQLGHQAKLATLVAERALTSDVVFLGPLSGDAKHAAMCNASAFILPSFSEGLPMAVLEAWAYALPVAMTSACNLPEGFAAGAAIEVGLGPDEMARGIRALLDSSDEQRVAMGARGFALVQARFSWASVTAQLQAVYGWILNGGSPPSCVAFGPTARVL